MAPTFFTPGPSQLYPTVGTHLQNAMQEGIPSISHRSKRFEEIFADCRAQLKLLLSIPDGYQVFFYASATEIWERLSQYYPGKSFFFSNGSFSKRFQDFSAQQGNEVSAYEVPFGQGFDRGVAKLPQGTRLCGMIGNESSTGVWSPPEDYYLIAEQNPDTYCFLDLVSAWPVYPLDLSKVDGAYFSLQKAFGLPAGMGVLVISPRACEQVIMDEKAGLYRGVHRSLTAIMNKAAINQTPETPNVLGIYLLGKVAADMYQLGPNLYLDSREKADKIYQYFEQHPKWQPWVDIPRWRSETVIVLETPNESAEIISQLREKGFIVASGYGPHKADQIRIANFPAHSMADVDRLLQAFSEL